jgi:hypothetical protein
MFNLLQKIYILYYSNERIYENIKSIKGLVETSLKIKNNKISIKTNIIIL